MGDIYIGETEILSKQTIFKYEDNILYLYLDIIDGPNIVMDEIYKGIHVASVEKHPLPFEKIDGFLLDDARRISFYFDKFDYGYLNKFNSNGSTFVLKINVFNFIIYTNNHYVSKVSSITLYSKCFQKYLNLVPNLRVNPIENGETNGEVNFKFESTNLKSSFVLNDKNFILTPTYKLHWSGPEFDFTPGLSLEFDFLCDEKELLMLSATLIKFIQYSYMRTNVFPDEIVFSLNSGFAGNVYLFNPNNYEEEKEKYDIFRDSLPWNELYKIAGSLFCEFYNDNIYYSHIPNQKIKRIIIDSESISKDAAAFENEFDKVFKNGIPYTDERKKMEEEIINELTPLMNSASTKKKRKKYKGFIKHVHMDSLCDKIEYALEIYEKCINKIKNKMETICNLKLSYEDIAEVCSGLRNGIDHGDKIQDNNTDKVFPSFVILKGLIYAIQLKRLGMEEDAIDDSINNLYLIKNLPLVN